MGLEAYIYYQCPFRPNGDLARILTMQTGQRILGVMQQHGVPSITMQVLGPRGPVERQVTRAEAERDAAGMQQLAGTCPQCPAATLPGAPACAARVDYPIDEVALAVIREAMEANAESFEGPSGAFVRSLLAAGNCDGNRLLAMVRSLRAEPSALGQTPVRFDVDGRAVGITPYMLLEHMFFRSFLDASETAALREHFRFFHIAVGNRIADGPGAPDANAAALFGSSPSLRGLAALAALAKSAEANGWSLQLDG